MFRQNHLKTNINRKQYFIRTPITNTFSWLRFSNMNLEISLEHYVFVHFDIYFIFRRNTELGYYTNCNILVYIIYKLLNKYNDDIDIWQQNIPFEFNYSIVHILKYTFQQSGLTYSSMNSLCVLIKTRIA